MAKGSRGGRNPNRDAQGRFSSTPGGSSPLGAQRKASSPAAARKAAAKKAKTQPSKPKTTSKPKVTATGPVNAQQQKALPPARSAAKTSTRKPAGSKSKGKAGVVNGINIHKKDIDAFKVFGVDRKTATQADVTSAYRRIAKQVHPDAGGRTQDFIRVKQLYDSVKKIITNGTKSKTSTASNTAAKKPRTSGYSNAGSRQREVYRKERTNAAIDEKRGINMNARAVASSERMQKRGIAKQRQWAGLDAVPTAKGLAVKTKGPLAGVRKALFKAAAKFARSRRKADVTGLAGSKLPRWATPARKPRK